MADWDFCYGNAVKDRLAWWFENLKDPPTEWSIPCGIRQPLIRTVRAVVVSSHAGLHAAGALREEEGRFTAEIWLPKEPAAKVGEVPKSFLLLPDESTNNAIRRLDEVGIWERRQPIESFKGILGGLAYWHAVISRERSNFFFVSVLHCQINPVLLEILRIYDDLLFGRRLQETRVLPERLPNTLKDENDFEICGEITLEEEENKEDQE